ncbi:MAG: MATE family efflux transporter, partial [Clostridia bacterium]|nr:MATE family efflux transporter [Clostridia bacterium]
MKNNDQNLDAMLHLPDGRLLLRLSVPIIASLMVQGLYSLVDSIFLARLGETALSAVSLSFVVQTLAASFFSGIATGINALLSRALGRRDPDGARRVAASGFLVQ